MENESIRHPFAFPRAAQFGKTVPKSKIYQHASVGSKTRQLFIREIEKITWAWKLAPETINLPPGGGVREIQVFSTALKTGALSHEVLRAIDKAIPSPILFSLRFNGKTRYAAAYKRPSEADKNKWVAGGYFESEWMNDDAEKTQLPVVLNMGALYRTILLAMIPLSIRKGETMDELVSRVDELRAMERDARKIETRMNREKQFNRRVELNQSLNELKRKIEHLKRPA